MVAGVGCTWLILGGDAGFLNSNRIYLRISLSIIVVAIKAV